MILVLGYDQHELGTDPVIDWLLYYGADFVKVSMNDLLSGKISYEIDVVAGDIYINGRSMQQEVSVIWYRRFYGEEMKLRIEKNMPFAKQLRAEIQYEMHNIVEHLFYIMKGKKWLPYYERTKVNKLVMLEMANRAGLTVPASRVLTSKKELNTFYAQCGESLITKPVKGSDYYEDGKNTYFIFTAPVTRQFIDSLPDHFFPTLFQERAKAEYEIRVFFLDGECFATAVLNANKSREVDRKLNNSKSETHFVPYKLPEEMEIKVRAFMKEAKLNIGCLDIIRDEAGRYVFLEVNPLGQYLSESSKCNYYLEKNIAEWLIKHDLQYEQVH